MASSEQGHERSCKRTQTLVIVGERRFSTQHIADEHGHKIDHLKGTEAFAYEANTVADRRQHS